MTNSKIEVFKQFLANNKISHAYIMDGVNEELKFDEVLTFIKLLMCADGGCNECNICSQVNSGNMSDLKVIEPDGKLIKKEQILELKQQFSKKSTDDQPQFYIIKKAETMNAYAFNSLLKFLEEPDDHIIGFLLVSNDELLPETIRSRCQVLAYREQIDSLNDYGLLLGNDEEQINKINSVIAFVNASLNGKSDMIFKKHQVLKLYNTGDALETCLKIIILSLNDTLKESLNITLDSNYEKLEKDKLTAKQIANLISQLGSLEPDLNYNLNNNLVMDKIMIVLQKRGEI